MENKESLFWGVILIVVGVIFLGNNFDFWNVKIFFDGWWTLFIIIPSIKGLFSKDTCAWSFMTLVLGILLLLGAQNIIEYNMIWKILVPLIIIVIGLSLVFENRKSKKISGKNAKEYVAVFSGVDEKIKEVVEDFRVVSVFGGIELDLRKAKIEKDIVINAVTVFGGIDLKLPKSVNVKASGLPIFGGVENSYQDNEDASVTIYINYTCIFGGVDIL